MTSNSNIACWLSDRAASDPSLPAIKQGEHILTYAALDAAAARCATLLADRGVTAGDRVALIMPNVAYFPIAYYAILALGAVVVPMNPLLKAGEVSAQPGTTPAYGSLWCSGCSPRRRPRRPPSPAPTCSWSAPVSSNRPGPRRPPTTARYCPRGRRHRGHPLHLRHHGLTEGSRSHRRQPRQQRPHRPGHPDADGAGRRRVRRPAVVPLLRQTCGLNAAIAGGACLTLLPKFDGEEALRIAAEDRVTVFLGVPTMSMALLAVPNPGRSDTSRLKVAASVVVAPRRGPVRGAAAVRVPAAGGIRVVGDLTDRLLQPPGPTRETRLGGHPDPRGRVPELGVPTTRRWPRARWARSSSGART